MRAHVWRDLVLVTLAGTILRLLWVNEPGHIVDLSTFGQWALKAADNPWDRAYEVTNANYPPGALVFFELIGRAYRLLVHADPDGRSLRVALKLPNIVFDLIGGAVAYAVARRFANHRDALIAAALIDLNPAIIYDSSLWGQNDAITTVTALAALGCVLARLRVAAWILLAFAVLNKPPVIVLAPLFVIEALGGSALERRRRLGQTFVGLAGAAACGYLTAIPFYTDRSIFGVYGRMIDWYQIGSSLYPFSSANAFNVYALFGDFFASDNAGVVLPLKYWADLSFIAIATAIYERYARRRDDRAFLEAAFLIMLAFFLVLTEMHERYLIYALTFAPPLAALDRRYLGWTLALTLTLWLNLEYSLTYMWVQSDKPAGINPNEFAPVLVRVCALTNITVFGLALRRFFGRNVPDKGCTGGGLKQR